MSDTLPGCCNECFREEEPPEPHLNPSEGGEVENALELPKSKVEVWNPLRDGHSFVDFVVSPMIWYGSLGQRAHQCSQVIGLFERALANFHDVGEVLLDL